MISTKSVRMFFATEAGVGIHRALGLVRGLICTGRVSSRFTRACCPFVAATMLTDEPVQVVRGEWFVVGADGIWYCQGNGSDGDAWDNNNLPGAVGWRVSWTAELEARVRALAVQGGAR